MSDQVTKASPINRAVSGGIRPGKVPAPGARRSPQIPGQVPDRSTVPGFHSTQVPKPTSVMRPLTQYQTAEEISKRFRKYPAGQIKPEQFEQADASFEELRKAIPADNPPVRPKRGYILDAGEEAAALPETVEEQAGEF
ncbi:MAG: hypothetical protein ACJ789_04875 [Thermomicrobiales bacterium]